LFLTNYSVVGLLRRQTADSSIMAVEAAGGRENTRVWTDAFVHKTRGARLAMRIGEDAGRSFSVPRLVVTRKGKQELFLDIPWALETYDLAPGLNHFAPPSKAADEAHVNVTLQGKSIVTFVQDLHVQLSLAMEERNWTKPTLVNWIDRALPLAARRDITKVSSTLFISKDSGHDYVQARHDNGSPRTGEIPRC
jgi:type III restriction enzyme